MTLCPLLPEEAELLNMLEGRQPHDNARFRVLVERLVERHWSALITYIEKRCFGDGISPETIVVDTFVKAIEILAQQMAQPLHATTYEGPMIYSRTRCPYFLGFVKALARWKLMDEAKKTRRYRTMLNTVARQEQQRVQQYGTLRSGNSGERICLRKTEPLDNLTTILWQHIRKLPSRESLVVELYCQHGPIPLDLQGLTKIATCAGLAAQEVRTLQRRFRKLVVRQPVKTIRHLTQDQIAVLFDVDRETIRRILVTGTQRLWAHFEAERLELGVSMAAGG